MQHVIRTTVRGLGFVVLTASLFWLMGCAAKADALTLHAHSSEPVLWVLGLVVFALGLAILRPVLSPRGRR